MANVDLEAEEAALDGWPRRLLHVPTMTSYEWQPGNIYGAATAPRFAAITYTWGRWRLEAGDRPDVQAITVNGVPWEIPRVNPDHFGSYDLHNALVKSQARVHPPLIDADEMGEAVEFVWLDVACIDQRDNDPRSAAEIGRQADIFSGADHVIVWLSTLDASRIETALMTLERSELFLTASYDEDEDGPPVTELLCQIYESLQVLFSDPWFSSLWTLQEAFLRDDAIIMSRDAQFARVPSPEGSNVFHHAPISYLDQLCRMLARRDITERLLPDPYSQIVELLRASGMLAIDSRSELDVYTATGSRTCSKDEDRIYGIQQIFGFRLGVSSRDSALGSHYNRRDLELQFDESLLMQYPVLSQMHVFARPAPAGYAWLVSTSSLVPSQVRLFGMQSDFANTRESLCKLSVRRVESKTWGYFEGQVCEFSEFLEACHLYERGNDHPKGCYHETFHNLHMYNSACLKDSPEYSDQGYVDVPPERQRPLAAWLAQKFKSDGLKILVLGSHATIGTHEMHSETKVIGLLLLTMHGKSGINYHRFGLCSWYLTHRIYGIASSRSEPDFLRGKGHMWIETKGLFG